MSGKLSDATCPPPRVPTLSRRTGPPGKPPHKCQAVESHTMQARNRSIQGHREEPHLTPSGGHESGRLLTPAFALAGVAAIPRGPSGAAGAGIGLPTACSVHAA